MPGSEPHYAPDLPFRLEHILLDVDVNPQEKSLTATTIQKIRVIAPDQKSLRLDQNEIQFRTVQINGAAAEFVVTDRALTIQLPKAFAPGETLEFSAEYAVHNPRRGIYFTGPDHDHPGKPWQVWSQGQDEDNRHWIPLLDYPNQKATSEIVARVPKGFTAVSNGALLSKKEEGAQTVFHYKMSTPHVCYLISLVVAEFAQWADQGPAGLPVQYFVAPGREEDGKRAFSHTPQMIEAYVAKTGVPYPYEKYSQVAVQDFIFGGMENTSATTQTDRTLHDARAHLDFSSDPLVSHELAHQWFGDLLTCRDWSHGWLNEGFATFMERVWIESNVKEYGSAEKAQDEAKYYSYVDLTEYQDEDAKHYRRPMVCNTYIEPIDLFDTHLYQKGGLVLNLLRSQLGEELFWKSVNTYVSRHRGQSVETLDLIRAIEDTTGRNMRRFFDEWVFGAGYPEFELSYQYNESDRRVELGIEQKQTQGKSQITEDGATTHLFHLPVKIEITLENGKKITQTIALGEAKERVYFTLPDSRPVMVRFDPENTIPKSVKFPRPKEMLIHHLLKDTDSMGRIEAAHELGKIADRGVVESLGGALMTESFWAVQAEIASVLGEVRSPESMEALLKALQIKHPKARRAVAKALGAFQDPRAAEALKKIATKDESYYVESSAIFAYAQARAKPGQTSVTSESLETEKFLIEQLAKESYVDVIRAATIRAIGLLPGISRGERPSTFAVLVQWCKRGKPEDARWAAVQTLGKIAQTAVPFVRAEIMALFTQLATEDEFRIRMNLVKALGDSESLDAVSILKFIQSQDADGRVKRSAMLTASDLHIAAKTPESVALLKSAYEKLEEEQRKLRTLVEELKGKSAAK